MPHIEGTSYGESRLRMLRVLRHGDRDDPRDVSVGLRFEGRADGMVPGEAVKNLVHRIARGQAHATVESLGLAIAERFLEQYESIAAVRVEISEQPWVRVEAGGKPQGHAFTPSGAERRTAGIAANRQSIQVTSGIDALTLLRTDGFAPHPNSRDASSDGLQRLFIASLSARWICGPADVPYALYREGMRQAILETIAWQPARSAREALRAIGDVALATYPDIDEVTLTLHERPYRPADLLELAVEGDALFIARDEPVGMVEVRLARQPG